MPINLAQIEAALAIIKPGSTVIIGCSGGADSTFLSYLAQQVLAAKKVQLILAHLNHNLRGKDSEKDALFIAKLGKKLSMKIEIKSVKFTKFSEEQGRQARQKFLEECRQKHKADYILLAHHADDNTETILMNFVRGSGLTGLQGMKVQNGKILRPLLSLNKADILAYLKKHKISYQEDITNKDNSYTRNSYRNQLIPLLKEKNPNLNLSLKRIAQNLAEIKNFLEQQAIDWLNLHNTKTIKGDHSSYDLKSFRQQHIAVQKEILRQLHQKTTGHLQELESKHLEEVLDLLMNSHSGKHKNLGKITEISIKGKAFQIRQIFLRGKIK